MGVDVRLAVMADAAPIGTVFARAFAADPVTSWVTPDPVRRDRLLRRLNTLIARYEGIPRGATWVAVDEARIVGAAIWQPPGPIRVGPRSVAFALGAGFAIGRHIPRMTTAGRTAAKARDWTGWYLQLLGVDPDFQSQGIGSALLRPQLALIDEASAKAGLETTVENLDFYARHGFEVLREIAVAPSAPTEFALRRAARVH